MKSLKALSWEDVYHDGAIDVEYEVFDEDSQMKHRVSKRYTSECWGKESYNCKNEKYIEDKEIEYMRKMMRGEIKRKGM